VSEKIIGMTYSAFSDLLQQIDDAETNEHALNVISSILAHEHGGTVNINRTAYEQVFANKTVSIRGNGDSITVTLNEKTEGLDG
jgi:hypothetical protein